jgi:hypothetical protein
VNSRYLQRLDCLVLGTRIDMVIGEGRSGEQHDRQPQPDLDEGAPKDVMVRPTSLRCLSPLSLIGQTLAWEVHFKLAVGVLE